MISNEERREIAKELRKLADSPYSSDDVRSDVRIEDVCYELGLERGFCDDCVDPESVKHLADLIDRHTCRIIKGVEKPKHPWGICSRCSALVDSRNAISNATRFLPTRFCPNCGAEVVE